MSRTNHPRGWHHGLTRDIGPRWMCPKLPEWKRILRRRLRRILKRIEKAPAEWDS